MFSFDKVFYEESEQVDVYTFLARPIVRGMILEKIGFLSVLLLMTTVFPFSNKSDDDRFTLGCSMSLEKTKFSHLICDLWPFSIYFDD